MLNPGPFPLCTEGITTARSAEVLTPITGLDGMVSVTLEARFSYGSAGTTTSAVVRTTLDGTNWIEIARFDFTTASDVKLCNLSGLTPKAIASYAPLGANAQLDGVLGNTLDCVITTTGTYANTTLSVTAIVR